MNFTFVQFVIVIKFCLDSYFCQMNTFVCVYICSDNELQEDGKTKHSPFHRGVIASYFFMLKSVLRSTFALYYVQ